jgi:hypothetical protein
MEPVPAFGLVAEAVGNRRAATSTAKHLTGRRTLVPCERREDALVAYLRSPRPVYLARVEAGGTRLAA